MPFYEPNRSHYKLLKVLGVCFNECAVVAASQHVPSGETVVVKRTSLEKCKEDLEYVQSDIIITKQLQHENFLPYYCSFVTNSELWTVMPLMLYGSARDLLDTCFKDGIPEIGTLFILRDVLQGLDYIHNMGIIHRSIRASHILISDSGRAVLTGLRYSCVMIENGYFQKVIHEFPKDSVKNLNWLSPEILQQNLLGYYSKSDIYSTGVTACELANGTVPFSEMEYTKMLLIKLQGCSPQPVDSTNADPDDEGQANICQRTFSSNFHAFVAQSMKKDPEFRPTASQLLNHPVMKQCRKSSITFRDMLGAVSPITSQNAKDMDDLDGSEESLTKTMENLDLSESWVF
ncbi:STRADA (predicted) [Pycnogonum litorale]